MRLRPPQFLATLPLLHMKARISAKMQKSASFPDVGLILLKLSRAGNSPSPCTPLGKERPITTPYPLARSLVVNPASSLLAQDYGQSP